MVFRDYDYEREYGIVPDIVKQFVVYLYRHIRSAAAWQCLSDDIGCCVFALYLSVRLHWIFKLLPGVSGGFGMMHLQWLLVDGTGRDRHSSKLCARSRSTRA
jgi:hypothetical protein